MTDNTISIARPIDEVWTYVADVKRVPDWQEDLREMHIEGAFQTGAKGSETRHIGRRDHTSHFRLTKVDPPNGFTFETVDGHIRPSGEISLTSEGSGTRVRYRLEMKGSWFMRPLVPMIERQAQKQQKEHLKRLKEILESGGDT